MLVVENVIPVWDFNTEFKTLGWKYQLKTKSVDMYWPDIGQLCEQAFSEC